MDRKKEPGDKHAPSINRRRFVQGIAAGGVMCAFGRRGWPAFADPVPYTIPTLAGTHFELTIDSLPVNFTGRHAVATAVNQSVPGPILKWQEGDTVTLAVTNRLRVPTSIHWHAIRLPSGMDGVPGLSFPGIAPGETFLYRIPVVQNGTYWYHSHSRFQEQTGLIGALVVMPRRKDPIEFDRDYVVFLSDWTDTNPETVFSNLKEQSDYYNYHRLTVPNFISEAKQSGLKRTIADRAAWGRMNMSPTDISDVSGATYTYLLNGNPPNRNWTGLFQAGERVRLRFINGSSMTFFDLRIPGLKMTVVQADGNDIEPVQVDEFRIGVAETYDVIVRPETETAYTIFAQSEDRSGYAQGTLAPRLGMTAAVPPMDPRPMRTMADMGMTDMDMSHPVRKKSDGTGAIEMPNMDERQQRESSAAGGESMTMEGMGHLAKDEIPCVIGAEMITQKMPEMDRGGSVGTTPFPQPGPHTMSLFQSSGACELETSLKPSNPVHMKLGPQVDNLPMHVEQRLNDPGVGLLGNGRRVLTYSDLRARYRGVDGRPPTREIELHLSGNMNRYIWGFNGRKFSNAEPIQLKLGERVRFVLINDTMMEHPIHLHGLWSELENGHGEFNPYKHTVVVKPSERVSYLVSADTPGHWAYHCHLLYHMEAGMFRTVIVS